MMRRRDGFGARARGSMLFICAILLSQLGWACRQAAPAEPYTPGLGELMTLQQMRHTKLWLAGEAGNWDLAAYEIKELGEGFDDIVKYHPTGSVAYGRWRQSEYHRLR